MGKFSMHGIDVEMVENLEAETMRDAREEAEEIVRDGEWGIHGASIEIFVCEVDDCGEEIDREYMTVEIEPDHNAMIREVGGDIKCRHDWTSEGEDGCRENPGVWSTGGTGIVITDHCRHCDLRRIRQYAHRRDNPTVEYQLPEND